MCMSEALGQVPLPSWIFFFVSVFVLSENLAKTFVDLVILSKSLNLFVCKLHPFYFKKYLFVYFRERVCTQVWIG